MKLKTFIIFLVCATLPLGCSKPEMQLAEVKTVQEVPSFELLKNNKMPLSQIVAEIAKRPSAWKDDEYICSTMEVIGFDPLEAIIIMPLVSGPGDTSRSVIVKTSDGGNTWYFLEKLSGSPDIIFFLDQERFWLVIQKWLECSALVALYSTADLGETWNINPCLSIKKYLRTREIYCSYTVKDIQFRSAREGFMQLCYEIWDEKECFNFSTEDGGQVWSVVSEKDPSDEITRDRQFKPFPWRKRNRWRYEEKDNVYIIQKKFAGRWQRVAELPKYIPQ